VSLSISFVVLAVARNCCFYFYRNEFY
jgi:hypothetical protein